MYCKNCGAKLKKTDKFCGSCGEAQNSGNEEKIVSEKTKKIVDRPTDNGTKTASVVLGVMSILFSLTIFFGFIISIVGLILGITVHKEDKTFISGIILNIIGLVFSILIGVGLLSLMIIGLKDLNNTNRLEKNWCCNTNSYGDIYSKSCQYELNIKDNKDFILTSTVNNEKEYGNWKANWKDYDNDIYSYKLTLENTDYLKTFDVKYDEGTMSISNGNESLYCTVK